MAIENKVNNIGNKHTVTVTDRSVFCATAITELLSFEENAVNILVGNSIVLTVGGQGLSVVKLSPESGEITITGNIDAVIYTEETQKKKGFFGRIVGKS